MTPRLFVVSAPSGTGKTTVVKRLVSENPGVSLAVSHTTRPPREREQDKLDYYFVSDAVFDEIRGGDGFLEHADVFGNRYGTSRHEVDEKLASGRQVILEIDWQGAEQVRAAKPDAQCIFLLPPSRDELEKRLRGRNTDKPEVVERRFSEARHDVRKWTDFDYVLVNDDIDETCRRMSNILKGDGARYAVSDEKHRACVEELVGAGDWQSLAAAGIVMQNSG